MQKCPSLAPFTSTIIDDLNEAYSKVQMGVSSLKNKEQIQEQTVMNIRQSIKDKAMANKNAVYRGSKQVKMATDEDMREINGSN
ncbi:hypothetical protein NQ314_007231 [Rhamnusium bicolor]|uniref:Uncharacterized protein n=1 Tax=Rhamnusium bicolor TaxID=1586634 RepID=A0AAV8YRI5_9CUCU|nr:hypothetical protein NQ314_007231 [Rhamnusium bicolor]